MATDSPFMDLGGDVVIINEGVKYGAQFAQRGVTTRKKPRTSIEIISEPLLHDFDEYMLGAGPAQAIRDAISKGIKNVVEFASPATLARRQRAAKAFEAGASWAMKRYSGGRTGPTPPNQTPRLFNDSSRLADGVFVRQNREDKTFTVNVPANRLDPSTFGAGFDAMLNKLRSLVPVLSDSRQLLADKTVAAAINQGIRDMITKGEASADARHIAKLKQLAAARKRLVLQALSAVGGRLGTVARPFL